MEGELKILHAGEVKMLTHTHLEKKRRTNPINSREKNSGKRWRGKEENNYGKKKKKLQHGRFFLLQRL